MYTYNAEVIKLAKTASAAWLHVDLGFQVWKTIFCTLSNYNVSKLERGDVVRVEIEQIKSWNPAEHAYTYGYRGRLV